MNEKFSIKYEGEDFDSFKQDVEQEAEYIDPRIEVNCDEDGNAYVQIVLAMLEEGDTLVVENGAISVEPVS